MSTTVTFINCFEVAPGRDEVFLQLWGQVNAYMATQPGYLDHSLHRARSVEAPFRFVNVARWASADAWRAAHDEGFRRLVGTPEWAEFPATPGLFDVVHGGRAAADDPQGPSTNAATAAANSAGRSSWT